MGTHNISEIYRGAWVALCVHPTHIDIEHEMILGPEMSVLPEVIRALTQSLRSLDCEFK
jgi:hypothetical protein